MGWRIYNKARSILADKLGRDWHQPEDIVRTGYLPVAPARVLPASSLATSSVRLDEIYLLQRSTAVSALEVRMLQREQAVGFMLDVMYHEWYSQLRLLLSWLAHRWLSIADYLGEAETILRAGVSNVPSVNQVLIPAHMPPADTAEELMRRVFP